MPSSEKRIASLTSGGSGISRGSRKRNPTSEEIKKSNAAVKKCREKKKKSEEYWQGKLDKIKLELERADCSNRWLELQIKSASDNLSQAQTILNRRKGLSFATTEEILNQAETNVDAFVTEVNRTAAALYPEPSIKESGIPSVVSIASEDNSDFQNTWNDSSFSNTSGTDDLGTSGNQLFTNFTTNDNSGVSSVVSNASKDASATDNQNRFYEYQVSGSSFSITSGTDDVHLGTSGNQPFTNFTSNDIDNSGVSSVVSNASEDASASDNQNTWNNLEENQESGISASNNTLGSEDMHFEASGAQTNQDFPSIDDGDAAFVDRLLKTM